MSTQQRSPAHDRLDDVDRQIIYDLMTDARSSSAPTIAERADVSAGTVRNRIQALEDDDIVEGYHAHIDFERANGLLSTLFLCNVPFADRERAARAANAIPGVINVRILMGGRRNFHVLAVGADTDDLRRIGTTLSEGGIEIEDEMILERETIQPFAPFGPDEPTDRSNVTDALAVEEGDEIVEVAVDSEAPIAGETIQDAVERGILADEPLVVAIEREGELRTPHGDTAIRPGDVVTVFACGGISTETRRAFTEKV